MIDASTSTGLGFQWISLAPSFIVIIGWWVVARQNDLRERRKDIRELIKNLDNRLAEILAQWQQYSALNGDDPSALILAAKIKSAVSSISPLVHRISLAGLPISVENDIILFRQQVTGADFDSKSRKSTDFDENRNAMISLIAMDIVRTLEEAYFRTYPAAMSKRLNWDLLFSGLRRLNR